MRPLIAIGIILLVLLAGRCVFLERRIALRAARTDALCRSVAELINEVSQMPTVDKDMLRERIKVLPGRGDEDVVDRFVARLDKDVGGSE